MAEERKLRRGLVGMPGYGELTAGAARALWRASRGDQAKIPLQIQVSYSEGSLLAQNFNVLWCQALNLHARGGLDYFGMLHADVEPEDGWFDTLIEEMEAKGLDILGAVVPIKDPKGLTSLALDRDDGDNFRPLCRLTMREVFRLPETFTSADIGHPLLLNTGCWVCKFNPEWASKVRFTINDRIVFNKKLGIYQAQVEPEDWYFSRLLHELELKIGATRKLKLNHTGKAQFVASEPWGSEHFDSSYVPESVLPKDLKEPIRFPYDVEGWLMPSEGRKLAELAAGKRVLEIGSYCGKSTICLAQTAKWVVSVDPHDGRGTPAPQDTYAKMDENLRRYDVRNVVSMVRGTAERLTEEIDVSAYGSPNQGVWRGDFDLIFIDGAHDLESVQNDIRHALTLLKPDGLLVFHDFRDFEGQHDGRWDPGVTEAVRDLVKQGGELLETHTTLAVVKPPQLQEASNG